MHFYNSYNLKKTHQNITTLLGVAQLLQASLAVMEKCLKTSQRLWQLVFTYNSGTSLLYMDTFGTT